MEQQPRHLDDIYDALGGPAEVGRAIDVTTEHAAGFKRRGRVPPAYWPALLEALNSNGVQVTNADLLRIYNERKAAAEPAGSTP